MYTGGCCAAWAGWQLVGWTWICLGYHAKRLDTTLSGSPTPWHLTLHCAPQRYRILRARASGANSLTGCSQALGADAMACLPPLHGFFCS